MVKSGDKVESAEIPGGTRETVAVTVRLDPERYEALKIHGARTRLTNQKILVMALDAYLANNGS